MVNKNIHLFLIPMPFFTFCAFGLLSFWVLLMPFFLNFYSGSSIQCPFVWEMYLIFSSRTEKNFWQFSTYMVQYFVSVPIAFIEVFDSYLPFGFKFLAWDRLYIIYCLPCFLSVGLFLSPPRTFYMWDWWSLERVFQTFDPELFLQGLSRTSMCS